MRTLVTAALVATLPVAAGPAAAQTYEFLFEFGGFGVEAGKFDQPWGIAVDPGSGNIVVSDSNNHRIQICDPTQSPVACTAFGGAGTGLGQFNVIRGIAVDPGSGNIVVSDSNNHRIQICDPTQSPVACTAFGGFPSGSGPGQFEFPFGVAVDPISRAIVVADTNNHRIQVCDPTQSPVACTAFGGAGTGLGQFNSARGVAVDPDNRNIVVADTNNHRIQVFGLVAVACDGFAAPFDAPIGLNKKKQRVIPLRMELFDEDGWPLGPVDIAAPTVSVSYSSTIGGGALDQLVDSPGKASSGNSFEWDEASQRWAFNLATKPYTAAGTYTVTAVAGDVEYVLDPTCSNTFVRQ